MPLETFKIFCYKTKNILILKEICQAAIDHKQNKSKDLTNIYSLHEWADRWVKVQSKFPRKLNSVILDTNIAEDIISDIRRFQNNKKWYEEKGVPFRRGFLLYGPPGTGKTSFVVALAGSLGLSICPLNLSGNDLDDERLGRIMEKTPENALLLVEDVDAIFVVIIMLIIIE
jgi:chaperone BCS1